jgi:hypothetical protein
MEIQKKFFRTYTSIENEIIGELRDVINQCKVHTPPFVVKRMWEREILDQDIDIFDEIGDVDKSKMGVLNDIHEYNILDKAIKEGVPFEFNNEGQTNPFSPYRMVWALEDDGFTYFVKTSLPPKRGTIRVIDVWRKLGTIPIYPLPQQKEVFIKGAVWDIQDILDEILTAGRVHLIVGDDDDESYDSDFHEFLEKQTA